MSYTPLNPNGQNTMVNSSPVVIASNQSGLPVIGTFWQTTQPVSLGSTTITGSVAVTGAFYQATQPVSFTWSGLTDAQLRASALPISVASIPTHAVTQSGTWISTGAAANGAVASGNPVLISGSDGTNARSLKVATDGTLLVNGVQDNRVAGTITTATSVVGPVSVANRNVTTITLYGTYAGVTIIFEATDDGTNWFPLQSINNGTGQAGASWILATNGVSSYDSAVGGYTQVRVRATAWTSGTVNVGISNQVFAYDPVVAALSQGLAANGAAIVGNPVLTGGSDGTNVRSLSVNASGHLNIADGGNSITVDGTVSINAIPTGTNAIGSITNTSFIATQATGSNLHTVVDSGTITNLSQLGGVAVSLNTGVRDAGTQRITIATNDILGVTGTFWQATQPISVVSLPLPSGAATESTLSTLNSKIPASLTVKAASTAAVATDPALVVSISPNNTIPVSLASVPTHAVTLASTTITGSVAVTGTFWQSSQPVTGPATDAQLRATPLLISNVPGNTATTAPSNSTTTGYTSSLVIKATAGVLFNITGFNSKATGQFIQLHDAASLPLDAAVPKIIFYVAGSGNFSLDLGQYGRYFATGIVICNSTTGPTKTIGAADCWIDAQYE